MAFRLLKRQALTGPNDEHYRRRHKAISGGKSFWVIVWDNLWLITSDTWLGVILADDESWSMYMIIEMSSSLFESRCDF